MKINKLSSLIIVLCLFGCNSIQPEAVSTFIHVPTNTIQPIKTTEPLSTPSSAILSDNITEITEISGDNQIILKGFQGYVFWLVWSKDGKRLFIGTEKSGLIIYDLIQRKVVANFYKTLPPNLVIQNLALSPDEKILAVAIYNENLIHLINPETGNQIRIINLPEYWQGIMTFSPDSVVLASANPGTKKVILWNVSTGKEIKQLSIDNHWIGKTWFTPDGKALIANSEENKFVIWDTGTWQIKETIDCESPGFFTFSPDRSRFVVIGTGEDTKANSIWDLKSCNKLIDLNGAQPWIQGVAYEPKGKYIAAGGSGGDDRIIHTITVWDANTGEHIYDLVTGDYETQVLAFSPNGTQLASGGYIPKSVPESEVIIWDMSLP